MTGRVLGLTMTLLWLAGCSGGTKPNPDRGRIVDGATNLNCAEIGDCADKCSAACGTDLACKMGCPTPCKAKGCPDGQPLFDKVQACVSGKCMLDCVSGGSACTTCVQAKCAAELAQCNSQKC